MSDKPTVVSTLPTRFLPPDPTVPQAMVDQARVLAQLSRDVLSGKVKAVAIVTISDQGGVMTDATWTAHPTTLLGALTRLQQRIGNTMDEA